MTTTSVTHDTAEWKAIDDMIATLTPELNPGWQRLHEMIETNMRDNPHPTNWNAYWHHRVTIDLTDEELAVYRTACKKTEHADRLRVRAKA